MTGSAARRSMTAALATVVGALLLAPVTVAQGATDPADDGGLTIRDSLYLLPLGQPVSTPECLLVLCPIAQPFPAVGSGPDAGVSGLRVSSFPFAPAGLVAESRSEPQPYDGAGDAGTASVSFQADRIAEGSGGTVSTAVRLEDAGGGTVVELPASQAPLDGTRHTVGPVAIDPSLLRVGHSYVAVARFVFSAPQGASVAARVYAPQLLAIGPKKKKKAPAALKPGKPVTRLSGRHLKVTARCPSGGARCTLQVRAALKGKTLGKGSAELQAAARHTFDYVLSSAELRRARRVGLITTTLRVEDENGRIGSAKANLRLAAR